MGYKHLSSRFISALLVAALLVDQAAPAFAAGTSVRPASAFGASSLFTSQAVVAYLIPVPRRLIGGGPRAKASMDRSIAQPLRHAPRQSLGRAISKLLRPFGILTTAGSALGYTLQPASQAASGAVAQVAHAPATTLLATMEHYQRAGNIAAAHSWTDAAVQGVGSHNALGTFTRDLLSQKEIAGQLSDHVNGQQVHQVMQQIIDATNEAARHSADHHIVRITENLVREGKQVVVPENIQVGNHWIHLSSEFVQKATGLPAPAHTSPVAQAVHNAVSAHVAAPHAGTSVDALQSIAPHFHAFLNSSFDITVVLAVVGIAVGALAYHYRKQIVRAVTTRPALNLFTQLTLRATGTAVGLGILAGLTVLSISWSPWIPVIAALWASSLVVVKYFPRWSEIANEDSKTKVEEVPAPELVPASAPAPVAKKALRIEKISTPAVSFGGATNHYGSAFPSKNPTGVTDFHRSGETNHYGSYFPQVGGGPGLGIPRTQQTRSGGVPKNSGSGKMPATSSSNSDAKNQMANSAGAPFSGSGATPTGQLLHMGTGTDLLSWDSKTDVGTLPEQHSQTVIKGTLVTIHIKFEDKTDEQGADKQNGVTPPSPPAKVPAVGFASEKSETESTVNESGKDDHNGEAEEALISQFPALNPLVKGTKLESENDEGATTGPIKAPTVKVKAKGKEKAKEKSKIKTKVKGVRNKLPAPAAVPGELSKVPLQNVVEEQASENKNVQPLEQSAHENAAREEAPEIYTGAPERGPQYRKQKEGNHGRYRVPRGVQNQQSREALKNANAGVSFDSVRGKRKQRPAKTAKEESSKNIPFEESKIQKEQIQTESTVPLASGAAGETPEFGNNTSPSNMDQPSEPPTEHPGFNGKLKEVLTVALLRASGGWIRFIGSREEPNGYTGPVERGPQYRKQKEGALGRYRVPRGVLNQQSREALANANESVPVDLARGQWNRRSAIPAQPSSSISSEDDQRPDESVFVDEVQDELEDQTGGGIPEEVSGAPEGSKQAINNLLKEALVDALRASGGFLGIDISADAHETYTGAGERGPHYRSQKEGPRGRYRTPRGVQNQELREALKNANAGISLESERGKWNQRPVKTVQAEPPRTVSTEEPKIESERTPTEPKLKSADETVEEVPEDRAPPNTLKEVLTVALLRASGGLFAFTEATGESESYTGPAERGPQYRKQKEGAQGRYRVPRGVQNQESREALQNANAGIPVESARGKWNQRTAKIISAKSSPAIFSEEQPIHEELLTVEENQGEHEDQTSAPEQPAINDVLKEALTAALRASEGLIEIRLRPEPPQIYTGVTERGPQYRKQKEGSQDRYRVPRGVQNQESREALKNANAGASIDSVRGKRKQHPAKTAKAESSKNVPFEESKIQEEQIQRDSTVPLASEMAGETLEVGNNTSPSEVEQPPEPRTEPPVPNRTLKEVLMVALLQASGGLMAFTEPRQELAGYTGVREQTPEYRKQKEGAQGRNRVPRGVLNQQSREALAHANAGIPFDVARGKFKQPTPKTASPQLSPANSSQEPKNYGDPVSSEESEPPATSDVLKDALAAALRASGGLAGIRIPDEESETNPGAGERGPQYRHQKEGPRGRYRVPRGVQNQESREALQNANAGIPVESARGKWKQRPAEIGKTESSSVVSSEEPPIDQDALPVQEKQKESEDESVDEITSEEAGAEIPQESPAINDVLKEALTAAFRASEGLIEIKLRPEPPQIYTGVTQRGPQYRKQKEGSQGRYRVPRGVQNQQLREDVARANAGVSFDSVRGRRSQPSKEAERVTSIAVEIPVDVKPTSEPVSPTTSAVLKDALTKALRASGGLAGIEIPTENVHLHSSGPLRGPEYRNQREGKQGRTRTPRGVQKQEMRAAVAQANAGISVTSVRGKRTRRKTKAETKPAQFSVEQNNTAESPEETQAAEFNSQTDPDQQEPPRDNVKNARLTTINPDGTVVASVATKIPTTWRRSALRELTPAGFLSSTSSHLPTRASSVVDDNTLQIAVWLAFAEQAAVAPLDLSRLFWYLADFYYGQTPAPSPVALLSEAQPSRTKQTGFDPYAHRYGETFFSIAHALLPAPGPTATSLSPETVEMIRTGDVWHAGWTEAQRSLMPMTSLDLSCVAWVMALAFYEQRAQLGKASPALLAEPVAVQKISDRLLFDSLGHKHGEIFLSLPKAFLEAIHVEMPDLSPEIVSAIEAGLLWSVTLAQFHLEWPVGPRDDFWTRARRYHQTVSDRAASSHRGAALLAEPVGPQQIERPGYVFDVHGHQIEDSFFTTPIAAIADASVRTPELSNDVIDAISDGRLLNIAQWTRLYWTTPLPAPFGEAVETFREAALAYYFVISGRDTYQALGPKALLEGTRIIQPTHERPYSGTTLYQSQEIEFAGRLEQLRQQILAATPETLAERRSEFQTLSAEAEHRFHLSSGVSERVALVQTDFTETSNRLQAEFAARIQRLRAELEIATPEVFAARRVEFAQLQDDGARWFAFSPHIESLLAQTQKELDATWARLIDHFVERMDLLRLKISTSSLEETAALRAEFRALQEERSTYFPKETQVDPSLRKIHEELIQVGRRPKRLTLRPEDVKDFDQALWTLGAYISKAYDLLNESIAAKEQATGELSPSALIIRFRNLSEELVTLQRTAEMLPGVDVEQVKRDLALKKGDIERALSIVLQRDGRLPLWKLSDFPTNLVNGGATHFWSFFEEATQNLRAQAAADLQSSDENQCYLYIQIWNRFEAERRAMANSPMGIVHGLSNQRAVPPGLQQQIARVDENLQSIGEAIWEHLTSQLDTVGKEIRKSKGTRGRNELLALQASFAFFFESQQGPLPGKTADKKSLLDLRDPLVKKRMDRLFTKLGAIGEKGVTTRIKRLFSTFGKNIGEREGVKQKAAIPLQPLPQDIQETLQLLQKERIAATHLDSSTDYDQSAEDLYSISSKDLEAWTSLKEESGKVLKEAREKFSDGKPALRPEVRKQWIALEDERATLDEAISEFEEPLQPNAPAHSSRAPFPPFIQEMVVAIDQRLDALEQLLWLDLAHRTESLGRAIAGGVTDIVPAEVYALERELSGLVNAEKHRRARMIGSKPFPLRATEYQFDQLDVQIGQIVRKMGEMKIPDSHFALPVADGASDHEKRESLLNYLDNLQEEADQAVVVGIGPLANPGVTRRPEYEPSRVTWSAEVYQECVDALGDVLNQLGGAAVNGFRPQFEDPEVQGRIPHLAQNRDAMDLKLKLHMDMEGGKNRTWRTGVKVMSASIVALAVALKMATLLALLSVASYAAEGLHLRRPYQPQPGNWVDWQIGGALIATLCAIIAYRAVPALLKHLVHRDVLENPGSMILKTENASSEDDAVGLLHERVVKTLQPALAADASNQNLQQVLQYANDLYALFDRIRKRDGHVITLEEQQRLADLERAYASFGGPNADYLAEYVKNRKEKGLRVPTEDLAQGKYASLGKTLLNPVRELRTTIATRLNNIPFVKEQPRKTGGVRKIIRRRVLLQFA